MNSVLCFRGRKRCVLLHRTIKMYKNMFVNFSIQCISIINLRLPQYFMCNFNTIAIAVNVNFFHVKYKKINYCYITKYKELNLYYFVSFYQALYCFCSLPSCLIVSLF